MQQEQPRLQANKEEWQALKVSKEETEEASEEDLEEGTEVDSEEEIEVASEAEETEVVDVKALNINKIYIVRGGSRGFQPRGRY
jgi:hypothetical protein